MSDNVFQDIGHDVKVAAEDVAHVVVEVVEFPDKLAKVLSTGKNEYPKIKADLSALVTEGKTVFEDGIAAAAAKGLNWQEDLATVGQIEAFAANFKTFVADVEATYNEINADVH
jgi:hypothetical protein